MESERKERDIINNINSKVNNNNSDSQIFIIICFHNELFKNRKISLKAKSNDVEIIELKYTLKSEMEKYKPKVYSINFKENAKRPSYLNLSISFDFSDFWDLEELYIKDKKKFIFADIKIVEKMIPFFMEYLNNILKINNVLRKNYILNLEFEDKLYIYKHYIDEIKENDEKVNISSLNDNLAYDFIAIFKNNKLNKLRFSNAINLFTLSYKNQNIFSFLLLSADIIYKIDKNVNLNNNYFLDLVNLYNKKNDDLYKPILNNKYYEKYIKLMDDFMMTYLLIYNKERIINDKNLSLNSEKLLKKIINERDDITQSTIILNEYLDLLYLIYQEKEKKKKDQNEINQFQIQKKKILIM